MIFEILASILLFHSTIAGISIWFCRFWSSSLLEGYTIGVGVALLLICGIMLIFRQWQLPLDYLWVLPALSISLLLLNLKWIIRKLSQAENQQTFYLFALMSVWLLWIIFSIRSYHGGTWAGDWVEHYRRAQFFLVPLPLDFSFLGIYTFTARPPLANAVQAFFMSLTGGDFAHFQLFSILSNSLVLLPLFLLGQRFSASSHPRSQPLLLLLLLLMVNPMFIQNSIYPWTRMVCTFYVLLALQLFLGGRENRHLFLYTFLAFLSLAAGFISHYSAGPFIIGFVLVYFLRERDSLKTFQFWKNTCLIGLGSGLVLAIWLGWAILNYGFVNTFGSNTSVTDTIDYSVWENFAKIAVNFFNTIIPHPFRADVPFASLMPEDPLFFLRDYFFWIYQVNLLFSFGICSLAIYAWHKRTVVVAFLQNVRMEQYAWAVWVSVIALLGVAVHGGYDPYGLAHICLQPLTYLGLVFLAVEFHRLSPLLKKILSCAVAFDFLVGVALQIHLLRLSPHPLQSLLLSPDGREVVTEAFGLSVVGNFLTQMQFGFQFVGDSMYFGPLAFWSVVALVLAIVICQILFAQKQ